MIWYLSLTRWADRSAASPDTLQEHLAWMKRQHESGTVILSGPSGASNADWKERLAGETGQAGAQPDQNWSDVEGIYLVRAENRQEAEATVSSDPFVVGGACRFDLIEWHVRQIMGVGPFTLDELRALHQQGRAVGNQSHMEGKSDETD